MKTKLIALAGASALALTTAVAPLSANAAPAQQLTTAQPASELGSGSAASGTSSAAKVPAKKTAKKRPTLKSGSKGSNVTAAQKRLKQLGYFLPSVDGKFGPSMKQAIWAIQKAAKIKRTGKVDAKTWSALDRGTRPKAKTKKGYVVEVNKKSQLLMIVSNGKVKTIFNTSTASGKTYRSQGRTSRAHTPTGTFRVYRQINGPRISHLGYLYRPKYFTGGYAVHGEFFDVPAYPASHGCVRVSNPAMDYLWKKGVFPKGTKVKVY